MSEGTLIEACLHICFSLFPFFIIGVLLFIGHSWLKYKHFTWFKSKNIPKNPKDRIRWILPSMLNSTFKRKICLTSSKAKDAIETSITVCVLKFFTVAARVYTSVLLHRVPTKLGLCLTIWFSLFSSWIISFFYLKNPYILLAFFKNSPSKQTLL